MKSLEMVPVDFMIGRWKGYEIKSNHKMDGLLEATGWYGKTYSSDKKICCETQDDVSPIALI